jgi:hypothetical protein
MLKEKFALVVDYAVMRVRDLMLATLSHKYFYKTDPQTQVENFEQLRTLISYDFKEINPQEWHLSLKFQGQTRVTKLFLHTPLDTDAPALIFHHGASQTNYMTALNYLYLRNQNVPLNVFSIKAAHHESKQDFLGNCVDSFLNWQLTLWGSILAVEEYVKLMKNKNCSKVIIGGSSMGGIVATMHMLLFNSADLYLPINAYPNIGKIFLSRAYKYAVDRYQQRAENSDYPEAFALEHLLRDDMKEKAFPILARFDEYIDYAEATRFWRGFEVKTFDVGHMSTMFMAPEIRKYHWQKIVLSSKDSVTEV